MADFNSKYTGEEVEQLLDQVANGEVGGEALTEADIANMGFTKNQGTITEVKMNGVSKGTSGVVDLGDVPTKEQFDAQVEMIDSLNFDVADLNKNKQDSINDLAIIREGAAKGATAIQPSSLADVATSGSYNDLVDKPTIPSAVTESTVSGWGFTKNTGDYSKPSGGIPKSDLASNVQESLSKAESAVQIKTIGGLTVVETRALDDGGMVYSTPSAATGDEDDILLSKNSVKTINGESIFGSGNINIEGGGGSADSGRGIEPLITETGIHELILEEMQPNKKYWLYLDVFDADGTITIGSFQGLGDEGSLIAEYFAVIDILHESAEDSSYSGTITLELPDVDIRWANGVPTTLDIGRYELSITCVSESGWSYYNAVLTPFKSI